MARRPDAPCAGGCGKLLWGGQTSLPAGQRMCRPCRRSPAYQAARRAAAASAAKARRSATCPSTGLCHGCSGPVAGFRRFCDGCNATKRTAHWLRKNAIRRGANPFGPSITVAQIGDRDGWRCHLCRRKVDPTLHYLDRMAATRDHLVPVSEGGDDSAANLRLAHRSCNSSRGTRGVVQLALVG